MRGAGPGRNVKRQQLLPHFPRPALAQRHSFREEMRFKFRAAFFKALNHMNDFFHSLARSVPSQIHWRLIPRLQSAKAASAFPRQHAPRQLQFALKLYF